MGGSQWKLHKIQQLCDNARGMSPRALDVDGRGLEDFITSIEIVLGSSGGSPPLSEEVRAPPRQELDELALMREQLAAMEVKISQRDTASSGGRTGGLASSRGGTSSREAAAVPPPQQPSRKDTAAASGLGLHLPRVDRVNRLFAAHEGDAGRDMLSWDGAQRATDDLYPVRVN